MAEEPHGTVDDLSEFVEDWMRAQAQRYAAWDPAVELTTDDPDAVALVVFNYADHLRGASWGMLNLLRDILKDLARSGMIRHQTLVRLVGTVNADCPVCDRPPLLDAEGHYQAEG